MKTFLRENWPWIVVPALIVLVLLAALILWGPGGDDSPFSYPIAN